MIIPICVGLGALTARRKELSPRRARGRPRSGPPGAELVPWFLIGFVSMAAANSAGADPC